MRLRSSWLPFFGRLSRGTITLRGIAEALNGRAIKSARGAVGIPPQFQTCWSEQNAFIGGNFAASMPLAPT